MNDLVAQFVWAACAQIWKRRAVHIDGRWQWVRLIRRQALRELWRPAWGRP